ncbi:hypothetical protein [Streptomyces sp. NPDC004726]
MLPAGRNPEGASGEVRVHRPVRAGAHVRPRGSDVRAGDLALARGTVLGPPQIGLLPRRCRRRSTRPGRPPPLPAATARRS